MELFDHYEVIYASAPIGAVVPDSRPVTPGIYHRYVFAPQFVFGRIKSTATPWYETDPTIAQISTMEAREAAAIEFLDVSEYKGGLQGEIHRFPIDEALAMFTDLEAAVDAHRADIAEIFFLNLHLGRYRQNPDQNCAQDQDRCTEASNL